MKLAFLIMVLLHGLIHVLGFVKGFELREVKELTLPISKPLGVVWLTSTFLFFTYGTFYVFNSNYAWLSGLVAVVVSQIIIFLFWEDAKFGTIPNIIILAVSVMSFGYHHVQKSIQQETAQLLKKNTRVEHPILTERDLVDLPDPVKHWLMNCGALGKPFIGLGKVTQTAEMQMKPEQDQWMTAKAIQYTAIDNPAFIWSVDVKMNAFLSFQGLDKFEEGKGEMLIKMNSLFNIVHERGAKLDEGTLQRYLGEMVWFPTLALSPYITWQQVDENTAKATMTYNGTSGSGTFYFNSTGDVTAFSALRYKGNDTDAKRYNWVMNIVDYGLFEGIKVPTKMTSTWKLDDKDWTWLKMEVTDIRYNENVSH
jgi:hypothetical protein